VPECSESVEHTAARYIPPARIIEGIDDICVLLPYDDAARTLVHALKYHGMPSVGVWLGGLAGAKTAERIPEGIQTYIVPVPLHPAKLLSRGYTRANASHGAPKAQPDTPYGRTS
jgi:predicted amidophosphoribosyltransferase